MSDIQYYVRCCLYAISTLLLTFSFFFIGIVRFTPSWSPFVDAMVPFVETLWWGYFGIGVLFYSLSPIPLEEDLLIVDEISGILALFIKLMLFHLIAESMLWVLVVLKKESSSIKK